MQEFKKLDRLNYHFSSCDNCEAVCCDGSKDVVYAYILLEDFEKVANNFPILFTLGNRNYLRPVILLTNGKGYCKYIQNNKCTIYENRPSVCKVYPLSPYLDDNIYIDNGCPAVSFDDEKPINNEKIFKQLENEILTQYTDKYIETFNHFKEFNKKENLTHVTTIKDTKFYMLKSFDSKYVKLHLKSVLNLNEDYFRDSLDFINI